MVDAMERKNLKLAVKNFGPIREGEVEFKPLTVFIGPNNSGKSYMATLLYAMARALNGSIKPKYVPFSPSTYSKDYEQVLSEWDHVAFDHLDELDKDLIRKIRAIVQECFDSGVARFEGDIQDALIDYFGIRDPAELIYQGNECAEEFSISLFGQDSVDALIRVGKGIVGLSPEIKGQQVIPQPIGLGTLENLLRGVAWRSSTRSHGYFDFYQGIFHLWRRGLVSVGMPEGDALYLPAGRSGLLQGWRAIASLGVSLIGRRSGIEDFTMQPFPGLAREFTQQLIEMMPPGSYYEGDESLAHATSLMEEGILRGRIELQGDGSLFEMTYESRGVSTPVNRSSSMVSELVPIHLWMSHLLRKGDVLIIDEPEAHLHPENQRLIAQVLVRLMNAGVRVVCATHSSLILHQLSNHILATSSGKLGKVGFSEHDRLNLEDIGVYLFELAEDGSRIKEVEVDSDFGISEDEFVRVAEQIGEETYQLVT